MHWISKSFTHGIYGQSWLFLYSTSPPWEVNSEAHTEKLWTDPLWPWNWHFWHILHTGNKVKGNKEKTLADLILKLSCWKHIRQIGDDPDVSLKEWAVAGFEWENHWFFVLLESQNWERLSIHHGYISLAYNMLTTRLLQSVNLPHLLNNTTHTNTHTAILTDNKLPDVWQISFSLGKMITYPIPSWTRSHEYTWAK